MSERELGKRRRNRKTIGKQKIEEERVQETEDNIICCPFAPLLEEQNSNREEEERRGGEGAGPIFITSVLFMLLTRV